MKTLKKLLPAVVMASALMFNNNAQAAYAECNPVPDANPDSFFSMTTNTGSISCYDTSSNPEAVNITLNSGIVSTTPDGETLFTGVTDLSSYISGITNGGSGNYTIDSSVWNTWDSIYIGLKQGDAYGLFLLTGGVTSGTWFTLPGSGTGLSHFIAFSGERTVVPVPAAAWLFGSALLGLTGMSRRKKSTTATAVEA